MMYVSDKIWGGNHNTHSMFYSFLPTVEVMYQNMAEPDRPRVTIEHGVCNSVQERLQTQSEYVILIAFPREQWLPERASLLRYT